jgi:hypothetical protein
MSSLRRVEAAERTPDRERLCLSVSERQSRYRRWRCSLEKWLHRSRKSFQIELPGPERPSQSLGDPIRQEATSCEGLGGGISIRLSRPREVDATCTPDLRERRFARNTIEDDGSLLDLSEDGLAGWDPFVNWFVTYWLTRGPRGASWLARRI